MITCDIFSFVSLARAGVWILFNGLLALLVSLVYVIREFSGSYTVDEAKSYSAGKIMYNNFEISLVVFMPTISTNHAFTYT